MSALQFIAAAVLVLAGIAEARIGSNDEAAQVACPPSNFSTVQNLDLQTFVSKRWHVQQQMAVSYLPASRNRCVRADYEILKQKSLLGYDVNVHNYAEEVAEPHKPHEASLCAKVVSEAEGKLEVAPCFLPAALAGPYWVVDYNEAEGYAVISGGAPSIAGDGGCRTGSGVNNAGFWIFTRQQSRNEQVVQKARKVAASKGFDLSVLHDVNQEGCAATLEQEDM
mmetsp:Transcript_51649/g.122934  ORF Transcript_51649/g.122934 Transcript_51649/m.122934 type:complete len:224 (-) Transcript_51649:140-811(-)